MTQIARGGVSSDITLSGPGCLGGLVEDRCSVSGNNRMSRMSRMSQML